jgi:hypothetical protein
VVQGREDDEEYMDDEFDPEPEEVSSGEDNEELAVAPSKKSADSDEQNDSDGDEEVLPFEIQAAKLLEKSRKRRYLLHRSLKTKLYLLQNKRNYKVQLNYLSFFLQGNVKS